MVPSSTLYHISVSSYLSNLSLDFQGFAYRRIISRSRRVAAQILHDLGRSTYETSSVYILESIAVALGVNCESDRADAGFPNVWGRVKTTRSGYLTPSACPHQCGTNAELQGCSKSTSPISSRRRDLKRRFHSPGIDWAAVER